MTARPTFISTVRDIALKLQNADGTALKDLGVVPPAAGCRLKSLSITSDDTAAQVLQLWKTVGAVDYLLGEISVPIAAGSNGATAAVDGLLSVLMPQLQTDGIKRFIDLAQNTSLKVKSKVAVTAAKTIYIVAEVGDFT